MMKQTTTRKPSGTVRGSRSLVALAAAAVLLPGFLAGCSPTTSDTDAAGSSAVDAKGTDLAECMRDKGYDVPDPTAGNGGAQVQVPDGVDPDQYTADLGTCIGDGEGAGDGVQAKPMEGLDDKLREAAACIREEGFSDYPDDEAGMRSYRPDDEAAFEEVAKTCNERAFGSDVVGAGE